MNRVSIFQSQKRVRPQVPKPALLAFFFAKTQKMEIIVLPYMAISFLIGWAIFSPLAKIENLKQRKFARIETVDLLAMFLPFSYLLAIAKWSTSSQTVSTQVQALIASTVCARAYGSPKC